MGRQTVLLIVLCLLAALMASSGAAAELKVGVVDLQKAMELSEEGQKAKAAFQKKVEQVQKDLKAKQDELALMKEEIDRQNLLLSDSARMEKQSSYQLGLKDFKRQYEDAQEELRLEDAKLSEKIIKDLQAVIEDFGKKEGYDLILEKTQSAVMYRDSKFDITSRIILLYDEAKKK